MIKGQVYSWEELTLLNMLTTWGEQYVKVSGRNSFVMHLEKASEWRQEEQCL